MASRQEIIDFADQLLDSSAFADYGPNGLQVHGADEVRRMASAVSCTRDVFERAAKAGAQLLIVHHGLFWRGDSAVIDSTRRERLRTLFDNDIALAAWHLPLDAHDELGNNALLRDALALSPTGLEFGEAGGRAIGKVGRYEQPLSLQDFVARVGEVVEREPLVLGSAVEQVRTVAICSGGAARMLPEAAAAGADVLVTGEPAEPVHAQAAEYGMAFVAAGHYATETFGIRALGHRLAEHFELEHEFLAADNPV